MTDVPTATRLRLPEEEDITVIRNDAPGREREDRPFGGLPPAERVELRKHAIEVAVAEVRFSGANLLEPTVGLDLQSSAANAGLDLPVLQPAQRQDVEVTLTAQGPASSTVVHGGWLLASQDGTLTVNVLPDVLVIQSTGYTRFRESLGVPLSVLLPALQERLSPALIHRVGLRYVNRLTDAEAVNPQAWRGRIADSLLGVLADDDYGTVTATQQQIEFALEPSVGALLRHGAFRDPGVRSAYSYLLDVDVFSTSTSHFDPDACIGIARRLNRSALSMFQRAVLSEYRDTMQPHPIETDQPSQGAGGPSSMEMRSDRL